VPRKERLIDSYIFDADDTIFAEMSDFIYEEKRIAMREDAPNGMNIKDDPLRGGISLEALNDLLFLDEFVEGSEEGDVGGVAWAHGDDLAFEGGAQKG
jgi:hypothetical protein